METNVIKPKVQTWCMFSIWQRQEEHKWGKSVFYRWSWHSWVPPEEEYYTPISHLVQRATPNGLKIQPWKLLEESIGSAYLI